MMEPIPSGWIDAISKLGFPAVLLLAGGFVAWKFGKAFHATVIVPVVAAHVNFLKDQTDISRTMSNTIQKQGENMEALERSQADMARSMRLLAEISHRSEGKDKNV